MNAFFALVRNDLRLFFADQRAVIATICVPIGIASFFGIVFGSGGGKSASKIPVLIADGDSSSVSQKIIAGAKADSAFTITEGTEASVRDAVHKGQTSVALVIPKDFGTESAQALLSPTAPRPKLTFLYDPAKSSDLQMTQGVLIQQVMQVVSQEAFPSSGMAGGFNNPCELVKEAVTARTGPNDDASGGKAGVSHVFVGMAVQGLLFFAVDFGIGMVRDRRMGLWKRLRAAPLPRRTLLGSRLCSSAMIGFLELAAVFGFGALVFGIRVYGSVVGFLLIGVSASLMVASFGMLIAALGKTEAQCRAASVPLVLAMSFLGGAWLPSFMMPAWVQGIAKALPSRWAIDGFDAVTWRGLDLASALTPVGVLLAFAAVFSGFAVARFRWEAD